MLPTSLERQAQDIFEHMLYKIEDSGRNLCFLVMRGLPGSGKSYVSKRLQKLMQNEGHQTIRICTDEILEMCEGDYLWEGRKMPLYHGIAKDMANNALCKNVPIVILDNTNIKKKDYFYYMEVAALNGYSTHTFVVGDFDERAIQNSIKRNSHSVPEEAIRRMAKDFQE